MAPLVDNAQILSAELLTPLGIQYHAYVWPFAIIWPVFLRYYLTPALYEKYINAPEWTFVWVGSIVTLQSLVWLSTNWSVNLKSLFTARKVKTVEDAQLVKVIPVANAGVAEICELVRDKVGGTRGRHRGANETLTRRAGRRKGQPLLPLPKAPLSLRPREEVVRDPRVRDRFRPEADARQVPAVQGHRERGRTRQA